MNALKILETIAGMVSWRELRVAVAYCPVCGCRRPLVKLAANEMAVRCVSCRASAVTMSVVSVLNKVAPKIGTLDVYELSTRGPLFHYFKGRVGTLTCSEYFADVVPGDFQNGVQCQDVQRLSFPDASYDLCTSTEVFEHVPDDAKGFSEMHRVLRPNGLLVFTVPLTGEKKTVERAELHPDGELHHLLPPEYHGDPISNSGILAFRNYGRDITERLIIAGFSKAEIVMPEDEMPWGFVRPVIIAHR